MFSLDMHRLMFLSFNNKMKTNLIHSDMSYATFQGNSEIWSHKTVGCLIQV
jgi:hypothetical protein